MPSSDLQLLVLTRKGDDRAARELWARFGPRLVALAHHLLRGVGGQAAALDAVQSVFVRLLTLDDAALRDVRDVGAFLAASTRNHALNTLRATARAADREQTHQAGLEASAPSPASPLADDPELRAALDELPGDLKETILLRHAAGLTFDQAALSLNEPKATIAARYRRAFDMLQERLAARASPHREPAAARGGDR